MTEKKKPKFLRRTWSRYSKLGKGRKKIQKWRRPTGRDNKMREKRGGYPAVVSIGYKKDNESRGKIKEMIPVLIKNVQELEKIGKNQIVVIGNIGKKNKIEIAKKAKQKRIQIHNLNVDKFLKQVEKEANKKIKKKEISKTKDKKSEAGKKEKVKPKSEEKKQ